MSSLITLPAFVREREHDRCHAQPRETSSTSVRGVRLSGRISVLVPAKLGDHVGAARRPTVAEHERLDATREQLVDPEVRRREVVLIEVLARLARMNV